MNKKLKLFSCYSGYGGAEFALKKANIPFEVVGISEIKKSAIEIYNLNHKPTTNYGDITKIDITTLPDFDLITGGFPCQDVSLAGLRDLSQGRTNTVFIMLDIIRIKKPKYVLLENVQGILSILKGELIKEIIRQLKGMGYAVSYELLYSKDYGIPQNRPRVWIAAELGRSPFMFNPFPKKEELKIFVKDILQYDVEHKYLTDKQVQSIIIKSEKRGKPLGHRINCQSSPTLTGKPAFADAMYVTSDVVNTILAGDYSHQCYHNQFLVEEELKIYDNYNHDILKEDIVGTLSGHCGSYSNAGSFSIIEPKPLDLYNNKVCEDGISPTLTEPHHNSLRLLENNKIRVLTPRECFRLQGFLNDEIKFGNISKTSLYDLAGNGWDVNIVSKIFKEWFK